MREEKKSTCGTLWAHQLERYCPESKLVKALKTFLLPFLLGFSLGLVVGIAKFVY